MVFMLSEAHKEKIRSEAREILDNFGKSLDSVKSAEIILDENKENSVRDDFGGAECGIEFRTAILKNAPKSDEDCIIAEKAAWE